MCRRPGRRGACRSDHAPEMVAAAVEFPRLHAPSLCAVQHGERSDTSTAPDPAGSRLFLRRFARFPRPDVRPRNGRRTLRIDW
jgi:hypothetical protein